MKMCFFWVGKNRRKIYCVPLALENLFSCRKSDEVRTSERKEHYAVAWQVNCGMAFSIDMPSNGPRLPQDERYSKRWVMV